jgi:hypothetical protein
MSWENTYWPWDMAAVLARNEEMQGRFQSEDEFETSLKMSFHTQYQKLSRRQALNHMSMLSV